MSEREGKDSKHEQQQGGGIRDSVLANTEAQEREVCALCPPHGSSLAHRLTLEIGVCPAWTVGIVVVQNPLVFTSLPEARDFFVVADTLVVERLVPVLHEHLRSITDVGIVTIGPKSLIVESRGKHYDGGNGNYTERDGCWPNGDMKVFEFSCDGVANGFPTSAIALFLACVEVVVIIIIVNFSA